MHNKKHAAALHINKAAHLPFWNTMWPCASMTVIITGAYESAMYCSCCCWMSCCSKDPSQHRPPPALSPGPHCCLCLPLFSTPSLPSSFSSSPLAATAFFCSKTSVHDGCSDGCVALRAAVGCLSWNTSARSGSLESSDAASRQEVTCRRIKPGPSFWGGGDWAKLGRTLLASLARWCTGMKCCTEAEPPSCASLRQSSSVCICEHCRAAAKACASDRQAVEQVIKRVPLQDQSCHEFSQPSQSHQGRLFATRHLKCLNSEAWDAANLPEHADPLSCSAGWS
eukprot:1137846-Pelagomonas_calceolata.AAC.2